MSLNTPREFPFRIANARIGDAHPFFLFAGPCVIESEDLMMKTAETLVNITQALEIPFVFKSSFDKANRSSTSSYRGPGLEAGLRCLERIKTTFEVPIITDVHEDTPLDELEMVDILQTPAFLCRQTNFIQKVARTQKPINIKKGQFLAPWDMKHVIQKAHDTGNLQVMACERGVSFGYNQLISDMRAITVMKQECQAPVVFDATHSVQAPGGQGATSGGAREFVPTLAKAAVAVGIHGLFMETHPSPDDALSDGPNMWPLHQMASLLNTLKAIDHCVKQPEHLMVR